MTHRRAASAADSGQADAIEVYRHSLLVRVTHWINAAAFMMLIPSGVLIVSAHPEFYWGETGYYGDPAWLRLPFEPNFVIGALGRNLHFLAAWMLVLNGIVYLMSGMQTRHFRKKLLPRRDQLSWCHIRQNIAEHARLRRPAGAAALEYNVLQKGSYLVVLFVLIPLMLLTGLTMSPGFTAAVPELFWLWGRQTARSLHLLSACALLVFVLVHIFEVFVAGARNEIRSMVTGRFVVPSERKAP